MRNNKKVESFKEIENKREIEKVERINLSYLDFIKEIENKEIKEDNKKEIESIYSNLVNLRFNNIKRVDYRVKRIELRENLIKELENRNIDLNKFMEISKKVISISGEDNENSNYMSIKV